MVPFRNKSRNVRLYVKGIPCQATLDKGVHNNLTTEELDTFVDTWKSCGAYAGTKKNFTVITALNVVINDLF